jgi:hypothetical protein
VILIEYDIESIFSSIIPRKREDEVSGGLVSEAERRAF